MVRTQAVSVVAGGVPAHSRSEERS
jgi:hypothetical protein